jgi:hypothetical protein
MGGDQYTKIHNFVFRDRRLKPIDMAIFGHMSTHAPGWQLSASSIAAALGVGETLVKGSLRRLKALHYLVYGQDRGPDGKVGMAWYWFTDLPAQLAAAGIDDEDTVRRAVEDALKAWHDSDLA